MGSHLNFKNMGDAPPQPPEGSSGVGRAPGNFSLARQPSIYSLTFDEFQNSMGGFGKDFGSMNMDEFLKNIWTAEEVQAMGSSFGAPEGGLASGNLQRQGSLTLPRTLSQKTVDEVWKDLFRENGGDGHVNEGSNLPQRQQTLGEMTLEEFLVRAGVVREDAQLAGNQNNSAFYSELLRNDNNPGLSLGFGQLGQTNGVMVNRVSENNNQPINQSPNLAINANGVKSFHPQSQQPQKQQQQQLFSKQPTVDYSSPLHLSNAQLANPGTRVANVGIGDPMMNNSLVQGNRLQGGGMGMVGLGGGGVTVATGSPANQLSSDGFERSNGDTSSLSPVSCVFNGGLKGKRCSGTVEKVIERRQRRMIKNRESAARSRARKQAYTLELEAEVSKLKEENEELKKKQTLQAEFIEMQKNQVLETMKEQSTGAKKRCLRRTGSGPW